MWHTILSFGSVLLCPLMMVVCMRGMFGGNKSCSYDQMKQPKFSSKREELEYVRTQMADLQARYERLAPDDDTSTWNSTLLHEENIKRA